MDEAILKKFARKYIWWKTPEEAVEFPSRVIAQVMNIGDYADVQRMANIVGDDTLRDVLIHAEIGQFSERSWNYWHYRLGIATLDHVPPLPIRRMSNGLQLMKPSTVFEANRTLIREIVLAHNALNPRVFGSVMKGCDTESSDLDLLIEPTPDTTLFDIGAIRHELIKLLGVKVDVVTPNALPDSFRGQILAEAKPV